LTWAIEFSEAAEVELHALDAPIKRRIVRFLRERLEPIDDPRSIGAPLRGRELGRYWKYRVGDYRLVCDIQDARLCVLVVRIGHRREVYR
jgi:mRNA interferase RelE/StbE